MRGRYVGALLVLCLALTGCVALPTSGPVETAEGSGDQVLERAADIDARPPQEGASPAQLAVGFLDAMTAWPIQTSVAKEFLTSDAADQWNPDAGTIIYSDYSPPTETEDGVRISLTSADRLDGSGGWRGPLAAAELSLDLQVVRENGEYRIANPPNALIVPTAWFRQRFRQVSLYFFDPAAEILVPEPVFVPIGAQLATSLVSALLAGPPEGLGRVVRSVVPPGLSVELSVPVSDAGVARVDLVGDAPPLAPEAAELLYAQFAWTLRQDPSISAFRIRIDGEELTPASGASTYDVRGAGEFGPAGAGATSLLYGLRGGALVAGTPSGLAAAEGPFGTGDFALERVAVSPEGRMAAGVNADGRRLLVAELEDGETPTVLVVDGTDLHRPTWDVAGRLWVLDRTSEGARLLTGTAGELAEIDVPEVSGADVRHLAVSRDGTRLASVVRSEGGDRVLTSRVVLSPQRQVLNVQEPTVVRPAAGVRIADLAWSDPVQLSVLTPAAAGDLFEVSTFPANGGFLEDVAVTVVLRGRVRGLAASPSSERAMFAVRDDALVEVLSRETTPLDEGVRSIDYAG